MPKQVKQDNKLSELDIDKIKEIKRTRRYAYLVLWFLLFLLAFKALETKLDSYRIVWILAMFFMFLILMVFSYLLLIEKPRIRCPICHEKMEYIGERKVHNIFELLHLFRHYYYTRNYYILKCPKGHLAKLKKINFNPGQRLPV